MTRKYDIDQLLMQVPLFAACDPEHLALISSRVTPLSVKAGTVLAREGGVGREFMVLIEGEATVTVGGGEVAKLGKGDFLGEVALLDPGPRTATVTADTDVVVEVMTHQEFTSLLLDVPELTLSILKGVAHRLRTADSQMAH